jgi:hypothetical protein
LIIICAVPLIFYLAFLGLLYFISVLIYKYKGGDLRKHLKNSSGKLEWDLKIKIALDIAKAMAFLNSKGTTKKKKKKETKKEKKLSFSKT